MEKRGCELILMLKIWAKISPITVSDSILGVQAAGMLIIRLSRSEHRAQNKEDKKKERLTKFWGRGGGFLYS
jgi:hypothetical protein